MTQTADAVVIGSGGLGAATAYYLVRGGKRVVLVDKLELATQNSARAAGLSQQVQVDDVLADLAVRGAKVLNNFAEITGVDLEVVVNGSVKLARNESDAGQLRAEVARGQALGAEIASVSAQEATDLAPWLTPGDALEISYNPNDIYVEHPSAIPLAFIEAMQNLGSEALGRAAVTDIVMRDGLVEAVETARGRIETPIVIDAAGAWTRAIGELIGRVIPLWPVRHQLCITEPLAEVEATCCRAGDGRQGVCAPSRRRPDVRRLRADPLVLDPRDRPDDFQLDQMQVDMRPLEATMRSVASEAPIFQRAGIAELRGGLPTMTPDGHFLIDQMPGVTGFYVVSGCNVGGLTTSPAIGDDLAGWILQGGDRPATLEPFRLDRFDGRYPNDDELRSACVATYTHKYDEEEVANQ